MWLVGAQPFCVFADPVPPSGGDCPRQPGQQRDGHGSLGQCFCRICELIPWACGSQDLDAGVVNLFHVLSPKEDKKKKMLFLLAGDRGSVCGKCKEDGLDARPRFQGKLPPVLTLWLWDIHLPSLSSRPLSVYNPGS